MGRERRGCFDRDGAGTLGLVEKTIGNDSPGKAVAQSWLKTRPAPREVLMSNAHYHPANYFSFFFCNYLIVCFVLQLDFGCMKLSSHGLWEKLHTYNSYVSVYGYRETNQMKQHPFPLLGLRSEHITQHFNHM